MAQVLREVRGVATSTESERTQPAEFGAEIPQFGTAEDQWTNLGPLLVLATAIHRAIVGQPKADLESQRLLIGKRQIRFDEIDTATVEAMYGNLDLRFGVAHGPQVVVPIRRDARSPIRERPIALSEGDRATVLAILRASSIEMPKSRYDPTGRFAQFNFPTNITRDQAIELVANPPGPGDKLPISEYQR